MNRTLLILATSGLLAMSACSGGDESAATTTVTATTEPTPTTAAATTTTASTTTSTTTTTTIAEVAARMPLTGMPLESADEIPDRPVLIIKVSNAGPTVRPQAGLNNADIVIEEIINDYSTRFAAVFHSGGSDVVGPIRSGRAQDPDFLMMLNAPLFAYSGANDYATGVLRGSAMVLLSDSRASGFYRRTGAGKVSPNNLYNSTESLWSYAEGRSDGRPAALFDYTDDPAEITGAPATQIDLVLDSVDATWKYDADTDMYYRYHEGAPHNTENGSSLEQVSAKNIVVMVADYGRSPDGNPLADVIGTNTAYVFSHGTVQTGTWTRQNVTDPPNLTSDAGEPILIQPGRTWIEIPRNLSGKVSFS